MYSRDVLTLYLLTSDSPFFSYTTIEQVTGVLVPTESRSFVVFVDLLKFGDRPTLEE